MSRDRRIATVTLVASIGLHAGLLAMVPWLWQETPPVAHKVTTRYVVRIQQPISAPPPSTVPPMPEPVQPVSPQQPTAVIDPIQPQRLQPQQQRHPVTLPQETPIRPAESRDVPLPKPVKPRKPLQQQRPAPVSRPRSTPPVPFAPPQAAAPLEPPTPAPSQPKQPSPRSQQASAAPQRQAGPESQDVIQTYLAQVFAALERHKYYPAIAQRRRLSGRVVVQFVILPDGRVLDPQITEQNGASPFSQAALTALRRASPLPAFPPKLEQPRLLVEVPIIYNLKGGR